MSTIEGGPTASNLVQRARSLILQPTATWAVIDGEPATVAGLYKGWVMPLAAIPAVCGLIGGLMFSGVLGVTGVIVAAVVSYLLTLAMVYVLALVIDALAPSFGGQKNPVQAFKVSAYSGTAGWLAGVFQLIPALAFLGLVGLYSLYLMYRGLPMLMKVPEDKALGYTALTVLAMIVLFIIIGAVTTPIVMMSRL